MRFTFPIKARGLAVLALGGVSLMGLSIPATASSHSDAPLIKQDPQANLTDVYAFIGSRYDNPKQRMLNVIAAVRPFSEPGDGPHYDRFADDARYSIHITDPATGDTLIRYDFRFSSVDSGLKNPDTILSYGLGTAVGPIGTVGGPEQNYTQTYSIAKVTGNRRGILGSDVLVAPPNVGLNTTPLYNDAEGRAVSGAMDFASLDSYTQQTITDLASGEVVFAGPRDDGFFADIPGTFDLLNLRILDNNGGLEDGFGQDGNGVDGFKGFNVLVFAIQIPVESLPSSKFESFLFGTQEGVGVYASVSRQKTRIFGPGGRTVNAGPWVQVNRLGNPLFNEALVALRDKDNFNQTSPTDDPKAFSTYAENSELAFLINALYGLGLVESGRDDLARIFIPDVLRVNTTTDPVTLSGQDGFSRLGFIGGDTTNDIPSGWPNGRRLGDDVIDIALTAIASGPSYANIILVGDNAAENDVPYNGVFPYSATPHSGTFNRKDPSAQSAIALDGDLDKNGVVDAADLAILLSNFGATAER